MFGREPVATITTSGASVFWKIDLEALREWAGDTAELRARTNDLDLASLDRYSRGVVKTFQKFEDGEQGTRTGFGEGFLETDL